jgi:predicted transporter
MLAEVPLADLSLPYPAVLSAVCLVVIFTSGSSTIAGDQIGLWLSAMLFCGIGAVGSFAVAELIKPAFRGVQAMEETAFLLRNMQRG